MTNQVLTQGLIAGVCAASLSAATASSDPGVPFHDVFVGIASVSSPTVTEQTTPTGGVTSQIDWNDQKSSGLQVSLTSLNGRGHAWGGVVWGAELVMGLYDITPGSFTSAGQIAKNGNGSTLNYRTYGGNAIVGYEYGIKHADGIGGYIEILPYIGGGICTADNELSNGVTIVDKQQGLGRYMDYGIKLGGFLTERSWVYGITVGYERTSAKATMDFSGASSELTIKGSGATIGFLAGYRF